MVSQMLLLHIYFYLKGLQYTVFVYKHTTLITQNLVDSVVHGEYAEVLSANILFCFTHLPTF